MGWVRSLKRIFTGDASGTVLNGTKKVYAVDTTSWTEAGSGRGAQRLSPRDQLQLLQRIARFIEKESVNAVAILEGRPLREVGEGEDYQGILVYYAERSDDLPGTVVKAIKNRHRTQDVVLFSSTSEVENHARSQGLLVMKSATLRKAMEESTGRAAGSGSRGRRRGRAGGRSERSSQQRAPRQNRNARPENQNAAPRSESANDGVSDLIDLI